MFSGSTLHPYCVKFSYRRKSFQFPHFRIAACRLNLFIKYRKYICWRLLGNGKFYRKYKCSSRQVSSGVVAMSVSRCRSVSLIGLQATVLSGEVLPYEKDFLPWLWRNSDTQDKILASYDGNSLFTSVLRI